MNVTITGRKFEVGNGFKTKAESRLKKFDRIFGEDAEAAVTVRLEKSSQVVEISIKHNGIVYRAENQASEMEDAFDRCIEHISRQIRKNKTRLDKKIKESALPKAVFDFPDEPDEEEFVFNVVRTKKFPVTPQTVDDAILHMNMVGHQFYLFQNMDTNEINVVYKRKDGDYGLLEPQR